MRLCFFSKDIRPFRASNSHEHESFLNVECARFQSKHIFLYLLWCPIALTRPEIVNFELT
jgi:hypothetical protein